MQAEIYWIKDIGPHRVATMPRPRAGDWLEDERSSLKQDGVDVLVSLLTEEEILYMDLEAEPNNCQNCGIEFISFPITDRETPESETITLEFVQRLAELVKAGKGVAIHCFAGIGRSSLIAACVLVTLGIDSKAAFGLIERSRGCEVPDTWEQQEWFYSFVSTMLKNNHRSAAD